MITKERLIAALSELEHVEEGVITLYANFAKALLKEIPDLEDSKKQEMVKLLSQLYRDSTRHKEMVYALIEEVEKGSANEY